MEQTALEDGWTGLFEAVISATLVTETLEVTDGFIQSPYENSSFEAFVPASGATETIEVAGGLVGGGLITAFEAIETTSTSTWSFTVSALGKITRAG